MGDVISLRLHRKRKLRADRDEVAAANRAKFGRTKADKEAGRAAEALEARRLDGHRLAPASDTTDDEGRP